MNKEGTVDDKEGLVLSGTLRSPYAYIRCVESDIWKNLYVCKEAKEKHGVRLLDLCKNENPLVIRSR